MTSLFELLADQGILAQGHRAGTDHRLICAECHDGRTKEKSLALTLDADDGAVWVAAVAETWKTIELVLKAHFGLP